MPSSSISIGIKGGSFLARNVVLEVELIRIEVGVVLGRNVAVIFGTVQDTGVY